MMIKQFWGVHWVVKKDWGRLKLRGGNSPWKDLHWFVRLAQWEVVEPIGWIIYHPSRTSRRIIEFTINGWTGDGFIVLVIHLLLTWVDYIHIFYSKSENHVRVWSELQMRYSRKATKENKEKTELELIIWIHVRKTVRARRS